MARVFVFGIGGTGERVMKSITMLMAAGMSTEGYDVVPIIIDHHDDLDERKNLNTLIDDYRSIYRRATTEGDVTYESPNGFFSAKIENIDDFQGQKNSKAGNTSQSFASYIKKEKLANDMNEFLVQTLYSTNNLNDSLKVGFRGSPNVGTVVLSDQMRNSEWFDAVVRNFKDGDRIFIISSIFGGTGASGFPLLEKLIRNEKSNTSLAQAQMGALTVMPYYGLGDPNIANSRIDSADFMTKAKSALTYYSNTILSDHLYYIGETALRKIYPNNEQEQKDDANFTELVGATAFFHFLKQPKPNKDEKLYYSRAIKEDKDSLNLDSLGEGYASLVKTVVDFILLGHLVDILPKEKYFPLSQTDGFDEDFYEDGDFKKLEAFFNNSDYGFRRWYNELSSNDRAFAVFSMNSGDDMAECVQGNMILDAEDESYYLLSMLNNVDDSTDCVFRNFLSTCYEAITEYTNKITETVK